MSKWRRLGLVAVVSALAGLMLGWLGNGVPQLEAGKRMLARSYMPLLTLDYPDSARGQITVLTVDDLDLAHVGLSWPLPLDYYQRLIDRLLPFQPRALFIDLLFLDDRPPELVARFVRSACQARSQGVPVYLASLHGQGRSSNTEARMLAVRTAAGQPCIVPVAPNLTEDPYDRGSWVYPLTTPGQGAPAQRSVALALACDLDPGACPTLAAGDDSEMALLWPIGSDPLNEALHLRELGDKTYERTCASDWVWVDKVPLLPKLLRDVLRGGPRPVLCARHAEVPLRALDNLGLNDAERDQVLRGRILMLGSAFQSHGDRIATPLGQDLAGVHAHAMALDNLLALRGEFMHSGDFEFSSPLSRASSFTLVVLLFTAVGLALWHAVTDPKKPQDTEAKQPDGEPLRRRKPDPGVWYRLWCSLGLLLRRLLSLGRWPGQRDPPDEWPGRALSRGFAAFVLMLLGVTAVYWLGHHRWQLGPLVMIEYVLLPLGVDFFDRGHKLARQVAALADASGRADPKAALRHWSQVDRAGGDAPG